VTPDPVLYVQSALLYTNSEGERRIRVHTWAAMTTPNFNDIIGSIDVQVRVDSWMVEDFSEFWLRFLDHNTELGSFLSVFKIEVFL
jgi:hypothetical protein